MSSFGLSLGPSWANSEVFVDSAAIFDSGAGIGSVAVVGLVAVMGSVVIELESEDCSMMMSIL